MPLAIHFLTGALFFAAIDNLWIAAAGALISHYAFDAIPHYDYEHLRKLPRKKILSKLWKIEIDFLIGAGLASFLFQGSPKIFAGGFLAILPDIIEGVHLLFPNKIIKPLSDFHRKIHCPPEKTSINKGVAFEIAILTLVIALALLFF